MAYGLDVIDLIYTDENLVDQGTLNDHEIDLDIAKDKNFELRSNDHIMTNGSLWYVDGTEFGGVVGKFESDPDNSKVIYTGRSFRGIQDAKIIEIPEGLNVVTYSGAITTVTNDILEEYDLSDFFVCDLPLLHEDLDVLPVVGKVDILSGTTVYDALMKIVSSINFSYFYEYNAKDKKVHMVPVVVQDWIDLMAYNRDNSEKFKSSLNGDFINHLICSGIDEDGFRRTIHLFLDADGALQPYSTVDTPIKDEDYILDKSKKVMTGIREISDYYETQINVTNNYELLTETPTDWAEEYAKYYKKTIGESIDEYKPMTIQTDRHLTFDDYQTLETLDITQGEGDLMVKLVPGTDWDLFEPDTVTIFSFTKDYRNWKVTIGDTDYIVNSSAIVEIPTEDVPASYTVKSDAKKVLFGYSTDVLDVNYDYWVADPVTRSKTIEFTSTYGVGELVSVATRSTGEVSYEEVKAIEEVNYTLVDSKPVDWDNNYSYYYKRSWDTGKKEYSYSSYASSSELDVDNFIRVTSQPSDWAYNYGQYYYLYYNGIKNEAKTFSGVSRDVYNLLTGVPEDWTSNFGSYYQIAYNVTYKKDKKTKTTVKYSLAAAQKVSGYKSHTEFWASVPALEKKKGQKNFHAWPDWVPNKYYAKETVTDPPGFNPNNCYLPTYKQVRPNYEAGNCFSKSTVEKAPEFILPDEEGNGVFFRMVKDHYADLVRNGSDTLLNQNVGDSYDVTANDYDFNIGDVVGGEDEVTGLNLPQKVTNKVVKIQNGVVYVDYEIGG